MGATLVQQTVGFPALALDEGQQVVSSSPARSDAQAFQALATGVIPRHDFDASAGALKAF
jgi:hypothetical protein